MEATVLNTPFNPIQLHLLRMFQHYNDEESLQEIKKMLFEFHCRKINEEGKRLWQEKGLSNEIMDEWLNTHNRTPYK
jgi:hypothetical protein